ncbi:MAG: LytTR family DNA-binding domain-containing protein [Oscillospiraceae bacterium]|jgi:DNA-binding LytR/AlgR family response regulator|nr:LytTR family DNA-binding domain-containing protein [Oscillospiraceae bacterium]
MKIAVCDDEQVVVNQLENQVSDFFKKKEIEIELHTYNDGNLLLADSEKILFDVLLLDIEMPSISGMEIANTIREENEYVNIIFVTNRDDLVYDSLEFTPHRFIRKSVLDSGLDEALTALVKKIESKNIFYEFVTDKGKVNLNISEIMYIEVFGHKLTIRLKDKVFETRGSLNKLEKEFKNKGFIRIHKCYLVNFRFIFSINSKDILLDDKSSLPLSRYKINETKLKFQILTRSM